MPATSAAMADHKKYALCNYVMIIATIAFSISIMAADWISYDGGSISLWQKCRDNLNNTDCNGNPTRQCHATATTGPVWLEVCRTMACFSLVMYFGIYYVMKHTGYANSDSLIGQIKLRSPLICYFISGSLMLTTAIVFHLNYKKYFSEDEKLENVRPSLAFFSSYIGGGISILNSLFLSSKIDTGFMRYVKSKCLCFRSCTNNGQENGRAQQNVEVRSRFSVFVTAMKKCKKGIKRGNQEGNTNTNSQTNARNEWPRIQSNLPSVETGQAVASSSDQNQTSCTGQGQGNASAEVFVVGNESGFLMSPNTSRPASAASVRHLVLEVGSLPGGVESRESTSTNTSDSSPPVTEGESHSSSNTSSQSSLTVTSSNSQGASSYTDYRDAPPPSYEEVMRSISNC